MRRWILLIVLLSLDLANIFAQSYNSNRVALSNFLVRMYENAPFDGVKVVEDYDHTYLMSVVTLDKAKYPSESVSNRVASVKAMSQASEFFNGSNIAKDMVIRTESHTNGMSDATIIEKIREKSVGYVRSLEQLTNFQRQDGLTVFIFICPIEP